MSKRVNVSVNACCHLTLKGPTQDGGGIPQGSVQLYSLPQSANYPDTRLTEAWFPWRESRGKSRVVGGGGRAQGRHAGRGGRRRSSSKLLSKLSKQLPELPNISLLRILATRTSN